MTNTLRSVGGGTPRPKRAALHLYAAREASEGTGRTTYGAILLAGNPASGRVDVAPGPTPSPGVGPNPEEMRSL